AIIRTNATAQQNRCTKSFEESGAYKVNMNTEILLKRHRPQKRYRLSRRRRSKRVSTMLRTPHRVRLPAAGLTLHESLPAVPLCNRSSLDRFGIARYLVD